MEPLGLDLPRSHREPTWEEWVSSLCPTVRELPSGERPGDWANDTVASVSQTQANAADPDDRSAATMDEDSTAPARRELPPVSLPQQYRIQFSTSEEHVRLVERAK